MHPPAARAAEVSLQDDHEGDEPEEVSNAITDAIHSIAEGGGLHHVAHGVTVLPLPVDASVKGVDIVTDLKGIPSPFELVQQKGGKMMKYKFINNFNYIKHSVTLCNFSY